MNVNDLIDFVKRHFVDLRRVTASDEDTHSRLRDGELVALSPCFAMPHQLLEELSIWQRRVVGILAHAMSTSRAIAVLNAAAELHGLWTMGEKPFEFTIGNGRQPARSRWHGKQYVSLTLRPEHWFEHQGIRVTTAERTCLDIARIYGFGAGIVALDSYLAKHGNLDAIKDCLAGMRNTKGISIARRVVEYAVENSGSAWESFARVHLIESGLPIRIETQKRIRGFYADICIDGWLIIEVDGREKYDGTHGDVPQLVAQEREREKEITNLGYRVLRYYPSQLRNPALLIAQVKKELEIGPRGNAAA